MHPPLAECRWYSGHLCSKEGNHKYHCEVLLPLGGLPWSQARSHLGANHPSPQRFARFPASSFMKLGRFSKVSTHDLSIHHCRILNSSRVVFQIPIVLYRSCVQPGWVAAGRARETKMHLYSSHPGRPPTFLHPFIVAQVNMVCLIWQCFEKF